jgi:hypothetical protein
MTGNLWVWRTLLIVLFVVAAIAALPVAAQSTDTSRPLTWTLAPTPGETLIEETPEETSTAETSEETPERIVENTDPGATLDDALEDETSGETPTETVDDEVYEEDTVEVLTDTDDEVRPIVVVETDEVPVEETTSDLPTFTPIQTVPPANEDLAQTTPLSPTGAILAIAFAAFAVVYRQIRR